MVAAEEDTGDFPALVVGGAGVVGMVEEAVSEGILLRGVAVAQDAGDQAHDSIGEDERRQHAAGEDIVANGNFVIDEVVGDALVDAFVVAAKEDEIFFESEFTGDGIGKFAALGREENGMGFWRADVCEGEVDRFDFHHHAGSAAVGSIIHRAVPVARPIAEVHRFEAGEVFFDGAFEDALGKNAAADFGEDRENLNFQVLQRRFDARLETKLL